MNIFKRKEPRRVASPIAFRRLVAEERRRQVAKAAALNEAALDLIRGKDTQYVDIVFDKVPGPDSAVFVEVEDPDGAGVRFGTWVRREDGYAALRISYWDAMGTLGIPGVRRRG